MALLEFRIETGGVGSDGHKAKVWRRTCDLAFLPRHTEWVDAGDGILRKVLQVYHTTKQTIVALNSDILRDTDSELERLGWMKQSS